MVHGPMCCPPILNPGPFRHAHLAVPKALQLLGRRLELVERALDPPPPASTQGDVVRAEPSFGIAFSSRSRNTSWPSACYDST